MTAVGDVGWLANVPRFDGAALCAEVDGDLFFPEPGQNVKVEAAKAICRGCEALAECLIYALDHDEVAGVWGGTSGKERRRLRAARRAA